MAIKIQLTPQQKQAAAAGVVLLGAFGFIYVKYFWTPVSARITKAREDISKVEDDIEKANRHAARLPQIRKEIVMLNEQAADAEKRLPKNKDLPAVIDTVSALARKHKVDLAGFIPGSLGQKPFFTEVPYAVSMSGSYHDVARFFASIALEERIFNVRNVAYSTPKDGKVTVNFTLISYQYKEKA